MKSLKFLFILVFSLNFSQTNTIFDRLSVLENGGKIWYNIDGYSVTSEIFNYNFDEKGLKKSSENTTFQTATKNIKMKI